MKLFQFSGQILIVIFASLFLINLNVVSSAPAEGEIETADVEAVEAENVEVAESDNAEIVETDNQVLDTQHEEIQSDNQVVETENIEQNNEVENVDENVEVQNIETENVAVEENAAVEESDNLNVKEPISLLPEQQSGSEHVQQIPQRNQNVEGAHSHFGNLATGVGSIFGGFGRAIGNSFVGNTATATGNAGVTKDASVERAERLNKGFERMIQFVNIMGQVDSFLSDRTKSVMRRLALLADDNNNQDDRYRRSHHRHHY